MELWQEALLHYDLPPCSATLLRHNENMTDQVCDAAGTALFVLRIHKPVLGFDRSLLSDSLTTKELVESELALLDALYQQQFPVQCPQRNKAGQWVTTLRGGDCATLLAWAEGQTLEGIELTPQLLHQIGSMTARMHLFFESCPLLPHLQRYRYDTMLFKRMETALQQAEEKGVLSPAQGNTMRRTAAAIAAQVETLPIGYVHADLSLGNLILQKDTLIPIDFSLSGFAPYEMDLGGLVATFTQPEQRAAILAGYEETRPGKTARRHIEAYFALSVLLFVSAQYSRAPGWDWFPGAAQRWCDTIFQPFLDDKPLL